MDLFRKKMSGFTLVEIMITISIISILTMTVLPSVGSFSDNNLLAQAGQNLASDIESVKFKALSGSYDGSATYPHWGITCLNTTSFNSVYYLTSFSYNAATNVYTANPTNRAINLTGGVTVKCQKTPLIFTRLNGKTYNSTSFSYTVQKNSKTITVTVDGAGVIGITKP